MMNDFPPPGKKKADILVVEAGRTQAEKLKYLLKKNQFKVIVAEHGFQALDILKEYIPMLILTDSCPGMEVYELCRKVKDQDHQKELPVIATTACVPGKPMKKDQLLVRMDKYI